MGDIVTWGCKMPDEFRDKINELIKESGVQNSFEFVDKLVTMYEFQQNKENQPLVAQDMDELETITRRILGIFSNISERITTALNDKDQTHQTQLQSKEELIGILQNKVTELQKMNEELEQEKKLLKEEARNEFSLRVNLESDMKTKVNQLTELSDSNKALIEEYKEKNDTLAGVVAEYKQYKEEAGVLRTNMYNEREARETAQKELDITLGEMKVLSVRLQEQKEKHDAEKQQLAEKMTFDKDKELLQKDKQYSEQLQQLRDEYNNKVKDLLEQMQLQNNSQNQNQNKED